jgi:hypothetical protein
MVHLCLASAVISLTMIGPGMDEMLASLQHVKRVRCQGGSRCRAFWGLAEADAASQSHGTTVEAPSQE